MPRPKLPPGMAKTGAQRAEQCRINKQRLKGPTLYNSDEAKRMVASRARVKARETDEQRRDRQDDSNLRVSNTFFVL